MKKMHEISKYPSLYSLHMGIGVSRGENVSLTY